MQVVLWSVADYDGQSTTDLQESMSFETFKKRMTENVPGRFYVSNHCLDCGLCRQTSPENFARNHEGGYSYVKKQPETPEELARCREALETCCTGTIFDDGGYFDWRTSVT